MVRLGPSQPSDFCDSIGSPVQGPRDPDAWALDAGAWTHSHRGQTLGNLAVCAVAGESRRGVAPGGRAAVFRGEPLSPDGLGDFEHQSARGVHGPPTVVVVVLAGQPGLRGAARVDDGRGGGGLLEGRLRLGLFACPWRKSADDDGGPPPRAARRRPNQPKNVDVLLLRLPRRKWRSFACGAQRSLSVRVDLAGAARAQLRGRGHRGCRTTVPRVCQRVRDSPGRMGGTVCRNRASHRVSPAGARALVLFRPGAAHRARVFRGGRERQRFQLVPARVRLFGHARGPRAPRRFAVGRLRCGRRAAVLLRDQKLSAARARRAARARVLAHDDDGAPRQGVRGRRRRLGALARVPEERSGPRSDVSRDAGRRGRDSDQWLDFLFARL